MTMMAGRLGILHLVRAALVALLIPAAVPAQSADDAFERIRALVSAGDRAGARAVADSLLQALPSDTSLAAEALYWRGFTSAQAADAERDYLRLSLQYPLSPRAPEALLALGQLEYARGDRAAARRRFERLLRDYPVGNHVAHAEYWRGTMALEAGERVTACQAFASAARAVAPENVELANQISYHVSQCAALPADTGSSAGATPPPSGPEYSIQVAAFNGRTDAQTLADRLRERGLDVRVAGARPPYRVRIGRYASRADALAALADLRRSQLDGIIVEAERR